MTTTETHRTGRPDAAIPGAGNGPGAAAPEGQGGTGGPVKARSFRLRYVIVGLMFVGAITFILLKGAGSSLNYWVYVNQAVHEKASLAGKSIRIEGIVTPGSIHPTPKGVDFTLAHDGVSERVVNVGSPPEIFQVGVPVIADGHFDGSYFASNQIVVKHTSYYIAATPHGTAAKAKK